jgi:hypothetical protein
MSSTSHFCNSYNDDGIPPYPAFAIRTNVWMQQQWNEGRVVLPFLALVAVIVLTGICWLVEQSLLLVLFPLLQVVVSSTALMMVLVASAAVVTGCALLCGGVSSTRRRQVQAQVQQQGKLKMV